MSDEILVGFQKGTVHSARVNRFREPSELGLDRSWPQHPRTRRQCNEMGT